MDPDFSSFESGSMLRSWELDTVLDTVHAVAGARSTPRSSDFHDLHATLLPRRAPIPAEALQSTAVQRTDPLSLSLSPSPSPSCMEAWTGLCLVSLLRTGRAPASA